MRTVFDSNILIYHLNGKLNRAAEMLMQQAIEETAYISTITRIEVLGWPEQSEASFHRCEELLDQFIEQPLTDNIVDRCVALRRQRRIRIPDAIIAATALSLNLPLVTRNEDDFKDIEGIELINPFIEGQPGK